MNVTSPTVSHTIEIVVEFHRGLSHDPAVQASFNSLLDMHLESAKNAIRLRTIHELGECSDDCYCCLRERGEVE